jgi:putative phosphoribosyl transferase
MFRNRHEAGLQLAELLEARRRDDPFLLAIPRGGIEVGCPVARRLNRPLDVIIPRKITSPDNPELAIGAVTLHGSIEINSDLVQKLGLSSADLEELVAPARVEIDRRLRLYRGDQPSPTLQGRDVILIDDGLATGYTMIAAIKSVQRENPRSVTVAVPVSPASTCEHLRPLVDDMVVLHVALETFFAVSAFYNNFRDLNDEALVQLLAECNVPVRKAAQPGT